MRILLAGGGSGGSAAPVIAVAEEISRRWPDAEFVYVGTRSGPEAALVREAGLPYRWVAAGRLRRFITPRNLIDPVLVPLGLIQAVGVVRGFRPDVAFGAGGFAAVPPLLAASLLRVPVVIHQQDLLPGLTNRLLAPFAARVTVAFPETAASFRTTGARAVGNPVRAFITTGNAEKARHIFGLESGVPTVLVVGGGTGALRLNQVAAEAAARLVASCQLIHVTGAGRGVEGPTHPRYQQREFLTGEMAHALAAADLIVTRAGMSALAEIAALHKAAVVVPMPDSHQEANAAAFARRGAAIVCPQAGLSPQVLADQVEALLSDPGRRQALGEAAQALLPSGAAAAICEEIEAVLSRR